MTTRMIAQNRSIISGGAGERESSVKVSYYVLRNVGRTTAAGGRTPCQ